MTDPERPSPFETRLVALCQDIMASRSGRDLAWRLHVECDGACPATHERTVLRVADELLCNVVEHGLRDRRRGCVCVRIRSRRAIGIQVSVSDDGWGFGETPITEGNGFRLLRLIGDLSVRDAATGAAVSVDVPLVG